MKNLITEAGLLKEWHPDNKPIETVTSRDATAFLWVCSLNHTWTAPVKRRIQDKSGCPVCANKIILPGYNDITTLYPEVAKEWHPTLNNDKDITKINPGSAKEKAWWVCNKGHEWETLVRARTKQNSQCPYCAGNKILTGYNDLQTLYPEIAKEFHTTLNTLAPQEIGSTYSKNVWWICEKGHEWETSVNMRTRKNVNCHTCNNHTPTIKTTSKPLPKEKKSTTPKTLKTTLKESYPEVAQELHPKLNDSLTSDLIAPRSNQKVWWICEKGHEYNSTVVGRTRGRGCPYCAGKIFKEEYNSLPVISPTLTKEWSPRNTTTPEKVKAAGSKTYIWKCGIGHEWEAQINDRLAGTKCPYCANRKVLVGFNDLQNLYPLVADEFHPTRNTTVKTTDLVYSSGDIVWWVCEKGHEWQNSVYNRTIGHKNLNGGHNCPHCTLPTSKGEQEVKDFITSLNLEIETNNRKLLSGKEVDIYIPPKKIAIEYNGLYWHSEEQGKDKTYHYSKYKTLLEQGITLIQIWEDDWQNRKPIVKNMLLAKLGLQPTKHTYARTTQARTATIEEAKLFLTENHIQGFGKATKHYALTGKNNQIAAILSILFLPETGEAQIVRFATSGSIAGAFTKLLQHMIKNLSPKNITTFSDNTVSQGTLYKTNGFSIVKELAPDYSYIIGGERYHKFNYRLERFKTDPTLKYDETLSETELAKMNGLLKIWDAGKIKWELIILPTE